MIPVLTFAVLGGMLTILSPCTLPVVPLLLGGSITGGTRRLVGIWLGFATVFVASTVVLASTMASLGLDTAGLRLASAGLLGIFGLTLVVPALGRLVERSTSPLATLGLRLAGPFGRSDAVGGLLLGGALAMLWAPCVGSIMAAVIASAVVFGPSPAGVVIALAYVTGALIPLAVIGHWGRRIVTLAGPASHRALLQRAFGVLTLAVSLLVVSGQDLALTASVSSVVPPDWSGALDAAEQAPSVQAGLDDLRPASLVGADVTASLGAPAGIELPAPVASVLPGTVALDDLGVAPELSGITAWINSDPLTLASLRGKVVLVQFWTFGCINCIHVQPYVKAWYDRYAADGFVVVGVHTPELSFERDIANVREAVANADVRFPVAFDPAFATWNAYRNTYWPAFYFIDRTGHIRHVHAGEGDYDGSEQVIRELLAQEG